ncbi:hypothetical protein BDK51DRAFT_51826 [Blyttiomyces helicus]|uniref:MYND-type domain-containing protein n=1 Tax=Blyttiomyces helicus TaxID=388810 RepID=A0A4P9WEX2_9FUNG|nr:hypothetical protein BDK51DRAFT_51826 [Blyttiomyces helicus]|eukprot:RKO91164.1 hypothetical protein BDK51DRAFT_51826 [Blyttiomyces helicus]
MDHIRTLRWRAGMPPYLAICRHISDGKPISSCTFCLLDAKSRLTALTFGQYALSTRETRPGHGHAAVYLDVRTLTATSESFKPYSRHELDHVLRELLKDGWGYIHPLHIAQDPNLFWPLVHYHGSIRVAIETIVPDLMWEDEIGPVEHVERPLHMPATTTAPGGPMLFPAHAEGRLFVRCAQEGCVVFEMDRRFSLCGKCKRIKYCSRECQVGDWAAHKRECVA